MYFVGHVWLMIFHDCKLVLLLIMVMIVEPQPADWDSTVSTRLATVCAEHSSAFTCRREEARPHQARAAGLPSLASRPTARPVQVVSADVQGAPWSGTAVYR